MGTPSRTRRWLRALVVLAGLATLSAFGSACAAEPTDARAWLARMHDAAALRNYRGTMVVTTGGAVSSSRVVHYCVGDQTYERVESLDGPLRRIYRHNDTVQTVWPQSREAVIERRTVRRPFRLDAAEPRALDQYEMQSQGAQRIAGRDAQVVLLKPLDALRYPQRLWSDRASGLMLRVDVLGSRGEVLESSAFSEVEIDIKPQPEALRQAMKRLDGYRVVRAAPAATQLEAEGWTLQGGVPGFALQSCIKRALVAQAAAATVLQAVFSDGLAHVSLFIEPYDEKRHGAALQTQIGATHTLMRRHGEHWITVMGEVPAVTLERFAQALERGR